MSTRKISLIDALITAFCSDLLMQYTLPVRIIKALRARAVFNHLIDSGATREMIKDALDRVN